jgi:hypothetical protein
MHARTLSLVESHENHAVHVLASERASRKSRNAGGLKEGTRRSEN